MRRFIIDLAIEVVTDKEIRYDGYPEKIGHQVYKMMDFGSGAAICPPNRVKTVQTTIHEIPNIEIQGTEVRVATHDILQGIVTLLTNQMVYFKVEPFTDGEFLVEIKEDFVPHFKKLVKENLTL